MGALALREFGGRPCSLQAMTESKAVMHSSALAPRAAHLDTTTKTHTANKCKLMFALVDLGWARALCFSSRTHTHTKVMQFLFCDDKGERTPTGWPHTQHPRLPGAQGQASHRWATPHNPVMQWVEPDSTPQAAAS